MQGQIVGLGLDAATTSTSGEPSRFLKAHASVSEIKERSNDNDQVERPAEDLQGMVARRRAVVAVPAFSNPLYRFELLQQWECVVREITEGGFTAVLYDLTDSSNGAEEATFALEDVPDGDRVLVEPGAVFYWSLGYRTGLTGEKIRAAQIRFRRLPALTRQERSEAATEAIGFRDLLGRSD